MRRSNRNMVIVMVVVCLALITGFSMFRSRKTNHILQHDSHPWEVELFLQRDILPNLMSNYQKLKEDIGILNQTLSKISLNVPKSKLTDSTTNKKSPTGKLNDLKMSFEIGTISGEEAEPSYNIHAFYYPWYGNPEHDSEYYHWNHQFIQHWKKEEAKKWPSGRHKPPEDVGANFYPALGAYSSSDGEVIDMHMQMMKYAKIGVVVVSWYPPGDADAEGNQPDSLMPLILNSAHKYGLKVALHIEPYKGRDHITWRENLKYIVKSYGSHPAFYRTNFNGKTNLPLYYIYDSYTVKSHLWAEVFSERGKVSVRNTELDGIFIGLLVEQIHQRELEQSGFDGIYTYFATNGFTYGSSWVNWKTIGQSCKANKMMFIPSVGPGYIDTEVRPWNAANTRKRLDGKYYSESFTNALKMSPDIISITSFNEWHEGTQIEPAVVKNIPSRKYLNYGSHGQNFYLNLTRGFVDKFNALSVAN